MYLKLNYLLDVLGDCLENNQFKPQNELEVNLVAIRDNNDNPEKLILRLLWGDGNFLILREIPAKY